MPKLFSCNLELLFSQMRTLLSAAISQGFFSLQKGEVSVFRISMTSAYQEIEIWIYFQKQTNLYVEQSRY
jgi:hypothetical protein